MPQSLDTPIVCHCRGQRWCRLLVRQPTDDASYKPSSTLPLLSAGPRLPSQLQSFTATGWYQLLLLGEHRHICVKDSPMVAT